ncbi:E3 ubiquitin ligase complex SCF subunit scon-3 [Hypoxylon sp. FL0890]|nr:E3 ubiquitin ligase complex SCF subunit scon-3 [Hypoxylon sp. FL0890]
MATTLTLASLDGEFVTASREVAKKSQILLDLMEDLDEEETQHPVPVQVDAETLKKIVQWCELLIEEEKATQENEQEKKERKEKEKESENSEDNNESNPRDDTDGSYDSDSSDPRGPFFTPRHKGLVELPDWTKDFFKALTQEEAFAIINAANFLDIQLLIEYTAKHIADQIKGMTTEQMREYFNIENDFTPEEENRIRRENAWASSDKYA